MGRQSVFISYVNHNPSRPVPSKPRSLTTLLAGAIDYAGLFPPANLDMASAVRNYTEYRSGEYPWALGRFIVPVSRLTEFERAFEEVSNRGQENWQISALAGGKLDEEIATALDFNKRHVSPTGTAAPVIDTIELKAGTIADIERAGKTVPSSLATYVEIPLEPDPSKLIAVIGKSGLRAKARTGGITPDAFPSSAQVTRFICSCMHARVSFKATAGLHHPLRGTYRLTYEPNSPTGAMYGFLNVFIATGVAQLGGKVDDVKAALEETSPLGFQLNEKEIAWRQYRLNIPGISSLRSELAISFGSCSFTEPIDELKTLKLL